jgi:hypothetical protein
MKTTILFASALLFLLHGSVKGQNSITVPAGKKIHSVNNSISTITQSAMGQEIEIKADATVTMDAVIKQISPDILLSINIGRVQFKSDAMGNTNDFDSDKAEDKNGQVGQLLSTVISKSFDIEMSAAGRLNKSAKSSDPATEAAKSMLGNFDELGGEMLLPVPVNLKAGDTWVDDNSSDADNKKKTEYSVVSANSSEAIISFKGTALAKANKNVQGMEAVVTSSSSINGELTIDIKSGVIKTKKTINDAKGTTEVMGQSIPFTIKQTMTTTNN